MRDDRTLQGRRIILVRHALTPGNLEKRYIGRTDEPLLLPYARQIRPLKRQPSFLAVSPMLRCVQSALLLLGEDADTVCAASRQTVSAMLSEKAQACGMTLRVEERLRECDFGKFEGRNYLELGDDPAYRAWIDSGGTLPFPDGEAVEDFRKRCVEGFVSLAQDTYFTKPRPAQAPAGEDDFALFVVHGGTIMSILSALARDKEGRARSYFDWQCANGHGFELLLTGTENAGSDRVLLRLVREVCV